MLSKDSGGEINTNGRDVRRYPEMLPIVLDGGTIHIKVTPRASSIVGENGSGEVSLSPSYRKGAVETDMFAEARRTIVIGGLINGRDIRACRRSPFWENIPLFGEYFRSTNTEKERSTVIIFPKAAYRRGLLLRIELRRGLSKEMRREAVEIKPRFRSQ